MFIICTCLARLIVNELEKSNDTLEFYVIIFFVVFAVYIFESVFIICLN